MSPRTADPCRPPDGHGIDTAGVSVRPGSRADIGRESLAEELSQRLLRRLAEKGEITSRWAEAMRGVPRHLFLPTVIYRFDRQLPGNDMVPVRRDTDLEQWLRRAYTNAPVTTQVDDGHPPPDGIGWEVTSSCSQPSVVAGMLEELQLEPGMRVLEIGTGTGWNAALLASVAGGANVTSIEIDPAVAARAHAALIATGHDQIALIVGDGALGWPDAAPYDRVIATVGSVNIPYPWIAQTRLVLCVDLDGVCA